METGRKRIQNHRPHGAFSLLELLVAVALVAALVSIVAFSGQIIRNARNRTAAEQQMAMIANAIDQYASFWPRWEVVNGTQTVVIADRGWPDFVSGRLFPLTVYESIDGFNSDADTLRFYVTDITYSRRRLSFEDPDDWRYPGDVLDGNTCLAYALSSRTGKGPYITDKDDINLLEIGDVHRRSKTVDPSYPPYIGMADAPKRQVLLDPWGTPYRYFWVYRDPEPDLAQRAYKGFLPVDYGPYQSGSADGGVDHTDFLDGAVQKRAETFVLESAGPDREFGNVWKASPSQPELDRAWDNLTVMP